MVNDKLEKKVKVYSTRNLDKFNLYHYNRLGTIDDNVIKENNLEVTKKSISTHKYRVNKWVDLFKTYGGMNINEPLKVTSHNNKLYISDGQHRLSALRRLKAMGYDYPVYYTILSDIDTEEKNMQYIKEINTIGNIWNQDERLRSLVKMSNNPVLENYLQAHDDLYQKYNNFGNMLIFEIMLGQGANKQMGLEGHAEKNSPIWGDAEKYCAYVTKLSDILKNKGEYRLSRKVFNLYFTCALRDNIWRKCNDENLLNAILKKLEENITLMKLNGGKTVDWVEELTRIITYNTRNNSIREFFEKK